MDIEDRMELIMRNTEEVVTPGELYDLLETEARPRGYIGIEPSKRSFPYWLVNLGSKISRPN
jgi:tyrosyl-tRNA synthetase